VRQASAIVLAVPLTLVLTACAADSDIRQVANLVWQSASGSAEKVPRERAEAIPFATMGLEYGSSPQAILVLGAVRDATLEWYAGEQVFVATRHGRIVRTAGLPYDLGGLYGPTGGRDTQAGGGIMAAPLTLDLPDLGVFGASVQCQIRTLEVGEIEIFGANIPTRHSIETCEAAAIKWKFDNEFWTDPASGYVWRSRQHVHPKAPPLILEVFRPEQDNPD
jgi:Group 4 capsule polysaccharide lipoprotein gfcB, YjbF